jgi:ABC-type multidrug transport system ATPase subunit
LLFLDEPTSGLDSTASRLVVAAVRQVAVAGVTAAAVIHQPSFQVFCMFDDVVLLAKGGRTAYYGPSDKVQVGVSSSGGSCCPAEDAAYLEH